MRQLDQAVVLLGKSAVRETVVSDAVQRAFQVVTDDAFKVEDFGAHCVAVGHLAQILSMPLQAAERTPEQQKDLDACGLTDVALAGLERSGLAFKLRLEIYEDPFVVGIMHDIGKVALVHSYPGLYKAIVEEMARQGWAIPMHIAEETIAGGADHTVVGEILADTWQLGETIGHIVGEHHRPTEGDSLVELVALADVMANAIFPLPADAAFPLARMAGTLTAAPASNDSAKDKSGDATAATEPAQASTEELAPFLPEGMLEQLEITVEDLVELTQVLARAVRQRVAST